MPSSHLYCQSLARRRFLQQAAALGVALTLSRPVMSASVGDVVGEVMVNGMRAMRDTLIKAGDRIETAAGASMMFRLGSDAFLLREMSSLVIESSAGARLVMSGLRLVTGGLVAVFGPGKKAVKTSLVTAAIRGTGIYVEVAADRSYFCTCYGDVGLTATDGTKRNVQTNNHAAHYIYARAAAEGAIVAAPMQNHSNQELAMLEKLVGRVPRLKP